MTTRGKAAEAPAEALSAIAEEALKAGAEPLSGDVMPFGVAPLAPASSYGYKQRPADLFPTPSKWAEYDQRDLDDVLNRDWIIEEVMFLDSTLQDNAEWFIALCVDPNTGERFTTSGGGSILVRKMRKMQAWPTRDGNINLFPMPGKFTLTESKTKGHSAYYDLI